MANITRIMGCTIYLNNVHFAPTLVMQTNKCFWLVCVDVESNWTIHASLSKYSVNIKSNILVVKEVTNINE
jgi:hypothetical protein